MANTQIIDLGYLNYETFMGNSEDATVFFNYRDRVATAINDGVNWDVSFAIQWAATTGGRCFGFRIRKLDAGVFNGKEWFIAMGGRNNTNNTQVSVQEAFQNSTQANNFFDFVVGTSSGDSFIVIYYNPDGLTDTFDIGTPAANGDAPATSPAVDAVAFMPAGTGASKGMAYSFIETSFLCHALIYNPVIPYVGYASSVGENRYLNLLMQCGDVIVPRDPADTFVNGCLGWNMSFTGTGPFDGFSVQAVDNAGNPIDLNIDYHSLFSRANQPRADGNFDVDPIKIVNTSFDKGFIRKDIASIQGRFDTDYATIYEGDQGPMVKWHEALTFNWSLDTLPLPFHGWPVNPQPSDFGIP